MHHEHLHHFGFFGNRAITSLYIMLAILSFAASLIGVFVPVYLYELGFEIWEVLFFYFLRSAWFVVLGLALLPLLRRMSDKLMMALAIPFLIVFFTGLSHLEANQALFWFLPAIWALYMQFFWVGFHLDFSGAADEGKVGREVGLRNMFMMVAAFAGPIVGGFLIASIGFESTFMVGSFLLFLALVPLFFLPTRKMPKGLHLKAIVRNLRNPKTRAYRWSAVGFANEKMGAWVVWPLFIFIIIGSVEKFGTLYSVGFLAAAIMTYLMGSVTDAGRGKRIMFWAVPLHSVIWFIRPFVTAVAGVAGLHVLGDIIYSALRVPWGSKFYKVVRKMPDPGTYIFSMEILYSLVRTLYLPVLMLLAYYLETSVFFVLALVLTGLFGLLYLSSTRQSLRDLS